MNQRQRGRRVPPPTPEQIAARGIGTVRPDDPDYEQTWGRIEDEKTLGRHQIAAAVVRNRTTGLYHAVLSLYGTDCSALGVCREQAAAEQLVADAGEVFASWYERSDDDNQRRIDALMDQGLAASIVPVEQWVLPDDQVREFLVEVARRQQRAN